MSLFQLKVNVGISEAENVQLNVLHLCKFYGQITTRMCSIWRVPRTPQWYQHQHFKEEWMRTIRYFGVEKVASQILKSSVLPCCLFLSITHVGANREEIYFIF